MKGIIKYLVGLSTVGILTVLWSQAHASGYKLEFQSASTLADAGDAAVVEDAGTNWYNSAGLVYLPQQLVMSGIGIRQTTTFTGSATAPANPLFPPGFGFSDSGSASSFPTAMLPAFHYAIPLPFYNNRFAFGLSVVPAWGLKEDYGNGSLVRYNLVRVYTKTIDIAPSLAMKLNDQWSVGVGPDIHYWSIQSSSHARTQGPLGVGTVSDSISRFSANDWSKGWHAGVLFRMTDCTRIGLNYRSQIVMHLKGYSDFDLNQVASFETNQFGFNVALPAVTTLSIYHDMSPVWALMGTIAYDQWSSIDAYYGRNYISPGVVPGTSTLTNVTSQQNFRNTLDIGIGTHYKLNDCWMLRASFKYEPTPTINSLRTLTFPDGPKYGFNIGARYRINPKLALDLIYAHVFTGTVPINDVNPASGATASGHTSTRIDLAGAQLVWDI